MWDVYQDGEPFPLIEMGIQGQPRLGAGSVGLKTLVRTLAVRRHLRGRGSSVLLAIEVARHGGPIGS